MCYKYCSSLNLNSEILCISLNTMTEFLSTGNIIEDKNLRIRDLDLQFVITNKSTTYSKIVLLPER